MALSRAQKEAVTSEVGETLESAGIVIVTHNTGMSVAQVSELRSNARGAGARYKVAKNRLVKLVLPAKYKSIGEHLTGPTGLTTSDDPVAAAKTVVEFAKDNEQLVVLGGAYGDKVLSVKEIEQLAMLPSLDELRGKLVALLQTPAMRIATLMQAPASQIARVISAKAEKG